METSILKIHLLVVEHICKQLNLSNTLKNFDPRIRNSIIVDEVCQKVVEDNDASVSVPHSRLGQPMKVQ